MSQPGIFVLLFLVATIVSLVARRLRIPYTVALVITGLALGASHALAAPALTHDAMFGLVLPALLFEAAFDLEIEEVRQDSITLGALAIPGVMVAIALVVASLGPTMLSFGAPRTSIPSSQAALLFAALVSATDPVAVVALFRALNAPRRLQVIIEGESLFNDGTHHLLHARAEQRGERRLDHHDRRFLLRHRRRHHRRWPYWRGGS